MNKNIIKPALRYPGSKFKKIDQIIGLLNIKKEDTFLDMFGGSAIVAVNVKHLIGCKVMLNDYDGVFPITDSKALKNMLSFQGIGKSFTRGALEHFNRRVENGYWDKLKTYNEIVEGCEILKLDWMKTNELTIFDKDVPVKIYVDPPYDDIKGLYKDSFNKDNHRELLRILEIWSNVYKTNILVSYNDTPFIRELYKDWYIDEIDFQYQTGKMGNSNKKKNVKELFITNFKPKGLTDSERNNQ